MNFFSARRAFTVAMLGLVSAIVYTALVLFVIGGTLRSEFGTAMSVAIGYLAPLMA
ncbi:MAG: hypothetical protein ACLQGV_03290 [Bryobacteraceae bacterium]